MGVEPTLSVWKTDVLPLNYYSGMRLCIIQTAQVAESDRSHRKHRHEMLSSHAV